MKENRIIATAVIIAVVFMVMVLGVVFHVHLYLNKDTYDEWIYTFYETYPELKSLMCKILKDGDISWKERKEFDEAVGKVQKIYRERERIKQREKAMDICGRLQN